MAGTPISIEDNLNSLLVFSKILSNIEHFVFFGTLLGLMRQGSPIEGDDDIDFYINLKHRKDIVEIIEKLGIDIDYSAFPNNTPYFIQFKGLINNRKAQVDFYFYENDTSHIIDRWNFRTSAGALRTPKIMVFPIQKIKFNDEVDIAVPKEPALICEYIYGIDWMTPRKKNDEYQIAVYDGKTIILRKDSQGKFTIKEAG